MDFGALHAGGDRDSAKTPPFMIGKRASDPTFR
jgi:hypothetical protein